MKKIYFILILICIISQIRVVVLNVKYKSIYKEELSAYDKFKEEEIAKLNNIV